MRIAPVLLPHLKTRSADLWIDRGPSARLTHNSRSQPLPVWPLVSVLWRCLSLTACPDPLWWVEEFASVLEPLECEAYPPRRAMAQGPVRAL